jgi:tetratricopeptide (TPR) repeat protein
LLAAGGEWKESARYLERLAQVSSDADLPRLALRLAEALAAAGDQEGARARLEEAFARDPGAEPVVTRLAETYRAVGDWRALAELLSKSAGHARDKGARLAALSEAAELFRRRCDAPEAAIPLLEQASDLEPDNRSLRLSLADAFGAAGRYAEARAVLRSLIDSFGGRRPKERAPVHYHLARLDLATGDRAQALVELDSAMRIDPANPEILRALAELARDDGQVERAERSYRALLAVLRRVEEPAEDAPIVRAEVLVELASLARSAGEAERASELVESALEVATKSTVEAARLEGALRTRGDYATLARAIQARIARGGAPEDVATALDALSTVLDERLDRASDALAARMRAIALAPHVTALHEATASLARRAGALPAYAASLLELAREAETRGDEDTACALVMLVGSLHEHDLGDDVAAVAHYERAQKFQLRLPEVLRALDRVYERLGDSAAQARVLAKRIDIESMSSGARASTDAYYRLAHLKMMRAESLDEGCDLLVTALKIVPDPARARSVLEATAPLHPTSARLIAIYETVGRTPGSERALVDALTLRAGLPDSDASPLREAVDVARSLGDMGLAETLLRKLVARATEDTSARPYLPGALVALADVREEAGDVADAVALKRQAAEIVDGDEARRLHFEVARLAKDALHDLALAARVYEELHAREPADREAWEPLLEVYRLAGAHDARVALIAEVVPFVDDLAERSRLRLERARVTMNELGRVDETGPMLREIVDDDPTQVDAAILLAGLLEKSGDENALAELLARQIDSAKDRSDSSSVAELSLRLGALVEKRDPTEARDVYYAALEWDAQNRECLRALVRLHESDDDPRDRAEAMERLLPLEAKENIEALARALAAVRSAMDDNEGARRALEAGFRASPGSAALREELEAAYAAQEEWANLAQLYEADAGAKTEPRARVARLREAARVWRAQAKDTARAADALRRARADAPEDVEVLNELVETLSSTGNRAAATLELTLAIDWLGDDREGAAPLLSRRAKLRAELGDDDGALFDFEHAFRLGGDSYAEGVVAHLTQMVELSDEESDPSRLRVARLRLAEILALTGDRDGARAILSELVKLDAKDRDALRALALLEEKAESWDAASATYRRLVALEDPENVVETALRLADACEHAGRLGDARGGLERARMVAPTHEALNARLLALYVATGAFRELAALHVEEAKAARDVAGRFAHLLAAGTLMLQHGTDPNAALVHLREANALRPGDLECCAWLGEGLAAIGKTQEALDLLTALLAPHKGRRSRELALVHQALAHVARAAKDRQGETASLTTALDMDPQNGAVASELALVAREAGQWELAQRALRAVTMLKAPAPLSRGLAYQYLGEIAQKQGDVKRAVMLLKRAVDDDPNLASARALLTQLKSD